METMANVLDELRADGWSKADHAELIRVVLNEPDVADLVTKALRSVVDFYKGRGAMLRNIQPNKDPSK